MRPKIGDTVQILRDHRIRDVTVPLIPEKDLLARKYDWGTIVDKEDVGDGSIYYVSCGDNELCMTDDEFKVIHP